MVKVMFRAQGNTERQPGVAVARRGSKLLVQYRIQNGEERERFIAKDRYEVVEGDVASLPVDAAPKYARKFVVTFPDGTTTTLGGKANQDLPVGGGFLLVKQWTQTPAQAAKFPNDAARVGEWALSWPRFETREAAEAYVLQSTEQYANGGYVHEIVKVDEK